MPAIQFYGIEQVMQAAENFGCPAWSIIIEGNMFTKFEGGSMEESLNLLQEVLEALERTKSDGIYTIKFFEVGKDGTVKINAKTVCDGGSFKFKLITPEQREMGMGNIGSSFGMLREMQQEIKELKAQLLEKENELADAEREENIGTVVMDLLKQPQQLAAVVGMFRQILNPSASVGHIPPFAATVQPDAISVQQTEDKADRIGEAIDTLDAVDPRLTEHLEKLADLAKTDPNGFNQLLSLLDMQK